MAELVLKERLGWVLKAGFKDGRVRMRLATIKGREFGRYADLALNPVEWERFTAWVEYSRAEENLSAAA
jgi:hypothetical protein